jgi:hypothetical protein
MNVNLHIERIVLDGIDLAAGETNSLQQAIVNQLTDTIGHRGLAVTSGLHRQHANIQSNSIRLGQKTDATILGCQLAHAVHAGLSQPELNVRHAQRGQR